MREASKQRGPTSEVGGREGAGGWRGGRKERPQFVAGGRRSLPPFASFTRLNERRFALSQAVLVQGAPKAKR